jgi:eukaryotic-like serine/threonine-protein kinase
MTLSGPISSPAASMPFPPGTVLAGKYRVDRLLGEGGMGWVVVATHLQLEQRVALKFMRSSHASASPEAVGRFLREARAAARIQSEYVARVSDVGTLEGGAPYLVMEYLEGRDLDSLLQATPSLPIGEAIEYAMQACEGLGEVHRAGIVHRDLKPANLFLARRSDGSVRVKLLDFGISKVTALPGGASDGGMTSTQALMGSPLYMAPEQMRSSKAVDARADIWSMGVILYEMLGGRSPFNGDTLPQVCARILAEPPDPLREVRAEVPPALEAVVMRCLEKDAQRRFQDVHALAQALAPFGQPDARVAADRIGRVMRGTLANSMDVRSEAVATTSVNSGPRPDIAQTAAAFGTAGSRSTTHSGLRRSGALPFVAGGAVLLVAGIVAIFATRGSPTEPAKSTAAAVAPLAPGPGSVSTASTPTGPGARSAEVLAPAPTESAAPPSAAPAASATPASVTPAVSSATAPSAATPSAATPSSPSHARAKPKAAAVPTGKPAATSGFGGRD